MIIAGKITSGQLVKILGIIQCVLAIVVTSLGITITIKFAHVHHEKDTPYEHATKYVNNQWTTEYGAAIWMGLAMLVAGVVSSSADVKPEKSKLTYASIILNTTVAIFSVVLIVFSVDAISWYKDCQYYYIQSNGTTGTNDCSSKDKSTGNDLYVALLVMVAIVLPISVATVIFSVMNNIVLFDDCCDGGCFRGLIYKFKGGGNPAVSFKTKNTHEFDQVSVGPQPFANTNVYA